MSPSLRAMDSPILRGRLFGKDTSIAMKTTTARCMLTLVTVSGLAATIALSAQQPQAQTPPAGPPAAGAPGNAPGQGGGRGGFGRGGTPIDYADNEGWVSLFDGQSLNGWDGDPRFWSVKDGAIAAEPSCEKPTGTVYLV